MKGLQQAGLVQGPVLKCHIAASKTRMRNQKAPRKSCAQRCMCSRRSSGPAQHCAPGCFLAQGCFYSPWVRTEHSLERSSGQAALRNICFTLHTERQGAQRDTSQGPVFARTLFVHWEDVFGGGVQRWLHSAHGHSVGKHRHGTKPCLQLRPRLNSLCSGCQESAIFRHEKCWITFFLLTLCWSEGSLGAPQVHSCSGWDSLLQNTCPHSPPAPSGDMDAVGLPSGVHEDSPARVVCGTQAEQTSPHLPRGGTSDSDVRPGPEVVKFQEEPLVSRDASNERAEWISCQMLFLRLCSSGDSTVEGEVAAQGVGGLVVLLLVCRGVGAFGVGVGCFVGRGF